MEKKKVKVYFGGVAPMAGDAMAMVDGGAILPAGGVATRLVNRASFLRRAANRPRIPETTDN